MSSTIARPHPAWLPLLLGVTMIAVIVAGVVGLGMDLFCALLATALHWHSPDLWSPDIGYFLGLGLPGALPFGVTLLFLQGSVLPPYLPPDRGLSWAGATLIGGSAYWLIGWGLFTFPPIGPAIRAMVDWGRATYTGDSATTIQLVLYLVTACGLGVLLATLSALVLCVLQWLALCTDRYRAWRWSLTTLAANILVGGFVLPLWLMLAWSGGL